MTSSSRSFGFNVPEVVGQFRILRPLGEGGMGVVFLGERLEQFSQQVAIKILHPHLFPESAGRAIEREGEILTVLDHPGIVRMLDYSVTRTGLRYIVMEHVDGLPLDRFCDLHRLSLRERVQILLPILDAVEYAHRHLVVHADLKPENILVTQERQSKLLDFGIATILNERATPGAESARGFTSDFASPEQRDGERLTITSDIYSLGLIAQLILKGIAPRDRSRNEGSRYATQGASVVGVSRGLSGMSSQSINLMADAPSTTAKSFLAGLHGDLEAILAKALHSDPRERFQSAEEMREDLYRHLLGYTIHSRASSRWSRSYKWVLRNQLAASLIFVFLMASLFSVVGVIAQATRAAHQRELARTRLHDLVRLTDVLAGELYESVHGLQGSDSAQEALLSSAHRTIDALATDDQDPELGMELANEYEKLARLELAREPKTPTALKDADVDIDKAMMILDRISESSRRELALAARQRSQEMARLRASILKQQTD